MKYNGSAIRDWRVSQGLTQQKLADMTQVSRTTISNLEYGLNGMSIQLALRLAEIMRVDVDDLCNSYYGL